MTAEITRPANQFNTINNIVATHDTYYEIDISTPFLPEQTMLIDKSDFEALMRKRIGRIMAKPTTSPIKGIVAAANTLSAQKKYKLSASYIHSLICEGQGYLWHRNGDLLDNRKSNLVTDLPWSVPLYKEAFSRRDSPPPFGSSPLDELMRG